LTVKLHKLELVLNLAFLNAQLGKTFAENVEESLLSFGLDRDR
jgi:hypothetical protein